MRGVSSSYAFEIAEAFFTWAQDFDERAEAGVWGSCELLQDYIAAWLEDGTGIEETGGDYTNFLLAVLIIIEQYTDNPARLDYDPFTGGASKRERRVERLLDFDGTWADRFDPFTFKRLTFRHLTGRANA